MYLRKLSKSANITTVDHDSEITENIWSYCKRYLEADEIKLPTFTNRTCLEYFKNSFKCILRLKHYIIPNLIYQTYHPHPMKKLIRVWKHRGPHVPWSQIYSWWLEKGTDNPENFRPITLEISALKIFTSRLRNPIYQFLIVNIYVNHITRKKGVFWLCQGLLNTLHTYHKSLTKQELNNECATITLIDHKNVFGEVHHNLIDSVFE